MNWDTAQGNWKQIKGKLKQRWGKLTDDQLEVIAGKRDHLVGLIQESYGIAKDEAERQLTEWEKGNARLFDTAADRSREPQRSFG